MRTARFILLIALVIGSGYTGISSSATAKAPARPPLKPADVDAIVSLLKLEDTRHFDDAVLTPLLHATHPEVRRRAVQAIGRIADPRGNALLASVRTETDPEILATVAFSTGQLKDEQAVSWLSDLLSSARTAPPVALEAARSLGKVRSPEARLALSRYLTNAQATSAAVPVIGEALLSSGRFTSPADRTDRADLTPVVRWTTSPNVDLRWRAAWALFRLADPAAIPPLLQLAGDRSPDVRYWAVRGLAATVVDKSSVDRAQTSAKLRTAVSDPDRRVRTEALRALTQYDDDASFAVVIGALDSSDSWLSVSAAEQLGRFEMRSAVVVPKLVAAASNGRPTSLRVTALGQLVKLSPEAAREVATALAGSDSTVARTTATQTLQRLDQPPAANAGARGGGGGIGRGGRGARPEYPARPDADYRRLVEQWIVPDYSGAPRPRATWDTPRGQIEIELYPGDAPFGVEYFMKVVQSGAIVGTEFGRVVPNFVAQQRAIANDPALRDEVSRIGLTRGNLSWASAGLDTGRPGYTLATAPHPHIEGDFTALGHVVRGLDVIDRLELGDRIVAARIQTVSGDSPRETRITQSKRVK